MRLWLLFRKYLIAFCSLNVRTEFEVRIALPVLEIIGGTHIRAVPGYAHSPFSPKVLVGFYCGEPYECIGQI